MCPSTSICLCTSLPSCVCSEPEGRGVKLQSPSVPVTLGVTCPACTVRRPLQGQGQFSLGDKNSPSQSGCSPHLQQAVLRPDGSVVTGHLPVTSPELAGSSIHTPAPPAPLHTAQPEGVCPLRTQGGCAFQEAPWPGPRKLPWSRRPESPGRPAVFPCPHRTAPP